MALWVGGKGAGGTIGVPGEEVGKRTAAAAQKVMDRRSLRLFL